VASPSLKIAFVSKTNGCVSGASFFAENLGGWLLEAGHEVTQFCVTPRRELRSYQRQFAAAGFASRLVRHANWRARQWGMVEPLPWEYWFGLREQGARFDLIHFHDLYMAISPRTLEAVARHKPVVLTMHDTSAFTGGCINPLGCRRFEQECGACPQKAGLGRFDFTRSNIRQVRRLAGSANVNYVFPSQWIQSEACRSLEWMRPVKHIPNGFDPRSYHYRTRQEARAILGIAPDRKVVAVSSAALENKLKGMPFALASLAASRDLDPLAIFIGHPLAASENALRRGSCLMTGFVEARAQLGLYFAAADVLLYPSLGDNLPITIQESMAAATPVLAFAVGGVPELVRPGQTGWLVPTGNQQALNDKLRTILESEDIAAYGERARDMIQNEFSVDQCVAQHLTLYRNILAAALSRRGKR